MDREEEGSKGTQKSSRVQPPLPILLPKINQFPLKTKVSKSFSRVGLRFFSLHGPFTATGGMGAAPCAAGNFGAPLALTQDDLRLRRGVVPCGCGSKMGTHPPTNMEVHQAPFQEESSLSNYRGLCTSMLVGGRVPNMEPLVNGTQDSNHAAPIWPWQPKERVFKMAPTWQPICGSQ